MIIEAVYRHGVFEPLEPVNIADEQRVQLSIEAAGALKGQAWLDEIRAIQEFIVRRVGVLPTAWMNCGRSTAMNETVVDSLVRRQSGDSAARFRAMDGVVLC